MNRSTVKGPFIAYHLLKKIDQMNKKGKKKTIKTWSRASLIIPTMIGHTIAVYNGRRHIPIYISDQIIGHKLGEFVPTRTFRAHKNLKTLKTKNKKTKRQ